MGLTAREVAKILDISTQRVNGLKNQGLLIVESNEPKNTLFTEESVMKRLKEKKGPGRPRKGEK